MKRILWIDVINLFTSPIWIFYSVGFPLILVMIFGFLTSGSYGMEVTSYDYYGVALMIYTIFNTSLFAANSLMEERIKSANMRIVYSPVKPFYIPLSKLIATFIFCSIMYTLVGLVLHFIVGVNYGGNMVWMIYIIMLLSILFFAALGVLVCCILQSEDSANQLISLILTLFAVIGGLFFPLNNLGNIAMLISELSPAKWLLSVCMQIIYDRNFSMFVPVCAMLIVLTVVFSILSTKFFKGEDYI